MKKIISLTVAVILVLSLAIIPVSAAAGEIKYGDVKKVNDSDIDMSNAEKSEPAWENAVKVDIARNRDDDADKATGTVYLLWSDTAYYAYFDITDKTPISDPDKAATIQPWVTDSVEIFIDAGNTGDFCEQFRIDRDNIPSYYPKDGAWTDDLYIGATAISDCEPVPPEHMSWAVKLDGDKYYVKLKVTYFGTVTPGDAGMHFQINDIEEEGGANSCTWPTNNEADSWQADAYGWVTLVDEPAYVAPVAVDEPAVADTVDDTAMGGGDENVHVEPAAAPAPVAVPVTGDNGIIVFAVIIILAGMMAVYNRKILVK